MPSFLPSLPVGLTPFIPSRGTSPKGMAQGKGQREQRGRTSLSNQQPAWVWPWHQEATPPMESSKWEPVVGEKFILVYSWST